MSSLEGKNHDVGGGSGKNDDVGEGGREIGKNNDVCGGGDSGKNDDVFVGVDNDDVHPR